MTRQRLVANLIYLILTYVQATFWSCTLLAIPNLQVPARSSDSSEKQELVNDPANMESLVIAEESRPQFQKTPALKKSSAPLIPLSFQWGGYVGPFREEKVTSIYTLGVALAFPLDPSEKIHFGWLISEKSNSFLYLSRESYLRNYWRHLKSWNYLLELEVDATQGLGAFLSFNHYAAGAGLAFSLTQKMDLLFNVLPFSSRGPAAELRFSYLAF